MAQRKAGMLAPNQHANGDRIAEARLQREMTQKELASRAGPYLEKGTLSEAHVRAVENGIYRPSLNVLRALCKVLDLNLTDVVEEG